MHFALEVIYCTIISTLLLLLLHITYANPI